jgi:hypothetical protein
LKVIARKDGKSFPITYKNIDDQKIWITNKDTALITVQITTIPEVERTGTFYDMAQYAARGLMMIRNINLNGI